MAAGIWLYARSYFFGISAQEIVPKSISFVNDDPAILTKSRIVPHFFLTMGYRFLIGEDFNLIPSLMVKYIRGSTSRGVQPEFNAKFQYRDVLWLGGSYRFRDSYAGMLGINIGNSVMLSYSYDLPVSGDLIRNNGANVLSPFHNGTHELVIGFLLGNRYSEKCPRCY
jgi:type IX secretion system PorP/SprF family membrane protein